MINRVGVAGGAGLSEAFEYIVDMALCTGHIDVRAGEIERCQGVVEFGALPGIGGVALGAVLPKLPVVFIIIGMASDTLLGCALVQPVAMAIGTAHIDVRAGKWEGRQRMVEGGIFPSGGGMASRAVLTHLSFMFIVLSMAGEAVLRRALE